jgi:hypothetical protein
MSAALEMEEPRRRRHVKHVSLPHGLVGPVVMRISIAKSGLTVDEVEIHRLVELRMIRRLDAMYSSTSNPLGVAFDILSCPRSGPVAAKNIPKR